MPVKDPNLTQDIARERARARAKKHYEAHKDLILSRRKNKRLGLNADNANMGQDENNDPNYEQFDNNDDNGGDDYNEPAYVAPQVHPALAVVLKKRRGRPPKQAVAQARAQPAPQAQARAQVAQPAPQARAPGNKWTLPEMKRAINDSDANPKTKSTNIHGLSRLSKLIDLNLGLGHWLKPVQAKKAVAIIKAKVDTGSNVNTMKSTAQSILWFADKIANMQVPQPSRILYTDLLELFKLGSNARSAEKRDEQLEATWPEYLARVDAKFGQNRATKSWLIPHMYGDSPDNGGLRDDLKDVRVASRMPPADSKENVLVVPRAGAVYLHVGSHKTKNKIGARKATYAPYLSDRIREFIDKNNIQIGEPIFGKGALSTFIGNLSESLGYKTRGIGFYRRMWGTDPDATPEQIIEHARILGHSTRAHIQSYQRRRA